MQDSLWGEISVRGSTTNSMLYLPYETIFSAYSECSHPNLFFQNLTCDYRAVPGNHRDFEINLICQLERALERAGGRISYENPALNQTADCLNGEL